MGAASADVAAQIREAFAGIEYPGDACLVNSREGTEPALLEKAFTGRTDWAALDPAFIDRAPDGFGTALSFFSDEAFRFYLPAYLLADLDARLAQADPVFILTHGLDDESGAQKVNPRRYGERTWADHARHRFAIFDARQASAIAAYLERKLQGATIDGEKRRIRTALQRYWAPKGSAALFLRPGEGRDYPMGRIRALFKADGAETAARYTRRRARSSSRPLA